MKKLLLLSSVLFLTVATGRAQEVYFTTEQLPDLIQSLPAPPDSLSHGFAYDVMQYQWGKAQRPDSARAEMAKRDAVWSYEALLNELAVPFGLALRPCSMSLLCLLVLSSRRRPPRPSGPCW